ncbi:hypothetical protein VSDG_08791 [Cytospora chrysosperma]|uniref:DUF6590 domain-containing protein n=1 Tax=Cytospora chrysosperma TaxID=252740 RepID=A0A423VGX2_CYTCH|nr:hypothetical protein VSDG_08791 [Valsa sordida]
MGKSEYSRTVAGSDSGYGDETTERSSSSSLHPLARKGYEIGPASKLQIGDVFEFLWADCPEFEYEWKCLGYTRFIVLRHSDSFPHYCTCVPISVGAKKDFAKPGIDSLQQGYVYASGERERDRDGSDSQVPYGQQKGLPQLPYSSVGIHLHSGRHRVKDDSRANYADVVEVDHEAQVMVVGDVARYFDRVRKNVNKAFMRQILRDALGDYCQRKKIESEAANVRGWGNSTVSLVKSSADDAERDDAVQGTEMDVDETQTEDMHIHAHGDGEAHLDEKYTEGSLSDETKDEDEDEWWDRQSTYTVNHAQSAERRASRAAQRAKAPSRSSSPGQEAEVAWRAGMDRAGLRSLRNLRRGAPSTDDYDDTLSLRSLAMAGRTPSILSRRSRR